jgi:hypothetical protein
MVGRAKSPGWLLIAAMVSGPLALADDAQVWRERFAREIEPVLAQKCLDCHGQEDPSGEFDLSKYMRPERLVESIDVWERMARRVRNGEMPPADSDPLTDDERTAMLAWVDSAPRDERCRQLASDESQSWYRGHVMSRRLTRFEYNNMIRDLFGVDFALTDACRATGRGAKGSTPRAIRCSPRRSTSSGTWPPPTRWSKPSLPDDDSALTPELLAARHRVLAPGQACAIGRGCGGGDLQRWPRGRSDARSKRTSGNGGCSGTRRMRQRGHSHLAAVRSLLTAMLVSPHFLFVVEVEPDEEGVRPLDGYELARGWLCSFGRRFPTRTACPGRGWFAAGAPGSAACKCGGCWPTRRPARWARASPCSGSIWARWEPAGAPDAERFPEFDAELADSMRREVVEFVTAVFRNDASSARTAGFEPDLRQRSPGGPLRSAG